MLQDSIRKLGDHQLARIWWAPLNPFHDELVLSWFKGKGNTDASPGQAIRWRGQHTCIANAHVTILVNICINSNGMSKVADYIYIDILEQCILSCEEMQIKMRSKRQVNYINLQLIRTLEQQTWRAMSQLKVSATVLYPNLTIPRVHIVQQPRGNWCFHCL